MSRVDLTYLSFQFNPGLFLLLQVRPQGFNLQLKFRLNFNEAVLQILQLKNFIKRNPF